MKSRLLVYGILMMAICILSSCACNRVEPNHEGVLSKNFARNFDDYHTLKEHQPQKQKNRHFLLWRLTLFYMTSYTLHNITANTLTFSKCIPTINICIINSHYKHIYNQKIKNTTLFNFFYFPHHLHHTSTILTHHQKPMPTIKPQQPLITLSIIITTRYTPYI